MKVWAMGAAGLLVLGVVGGAGWGQGAPGAPVANPVELTEGPLAVPAQAPGEGGAVPMVISGQSYNLGGVRMYVEGLPFSLTSKTTRTLTLPDGTKRTTEAEEHLFRDSEGRFRQESGTVKDGQFVVRSVVIFDPVGLSQISFRPGGGKAMLTQVSARIAPTPEDEARAESQRVAAENYRRRHPESGGEEELGTRTIAGEEATGVRRTRVFPAAGNRPAVTRTTETWTSRGLEVPVLEIEDSATHHMERTAVEVTRAEPDAALFRLPPGYEVQVRMRGEFGVNLAGIRPPVALYTPEPEYSKEALRKKISGNVLVGVKVMEDGSIANVQVERGLGYGLDEEAVKCVMKYKFRPAMREGQAVAMEMKIEVNFQTF